MSALGQKRTSGRVGRLDPESLGRLQVDEKLELC